MSKSLNRAWTVLTRTKTIQSVHEEFKKDLSFLDLGSIGLSVTVGIGGYVLLVRISNESDGLSLLLSVLLVFLSSLLASLVYIELGTEMPSKSGLYGHVYATLGEFPAFLLAIHLLFDLVVLSALAARSITEYIENVSDSWKLKEFLEEKIPVLQELSLLGSKLDVVAVFVILLSQVLVSIATKVTCVLNTVCTGMAFLILTAASVASLVKNNGNTVYSVGSLFESGVEKIMKESSSLVIAVAGWIFVSMMSPECRKHASIIKTFSIAVPTFSLLILLIVAVAINASSQTPEDSVCLTDFFPKNSFTVIRPLIFIGGCLSLWASLVGSLMVSSRLLFYLSKDGLIPSIFSASSHVFGTPWPNICMCGTVSAIVACIFSSDLLAKASGFGSISVCVMCGASLITHRYHPDIQSFIKEIKTYPKYGECFSQNSPMPELQQLDADFTKENDNLNEESLPFEVTVEWTNSGYETVVTNLPPSRPTYMSWKIVRYLMFTYMTNCIAGATLARISNFLGALWSWVGAFLCMGGCLVSAIGIWLQPSHSPEQSRSYRSRSSFVALFSIVLNIFLIIHLHKIALLVGTAVSTTGLFVWLSYGRRNSMQALFNKVVYNSNT